MLNMHPLLLRCSKTTLTSTMCRYMDTQNIFNPQQQLQNMQHTIMQSHRLKLQDMLLHAITTLLTFIIMLINMLS